MNVKLDRRIEIQKKTATRESTFNSESITWPVYVTVWAEVQAGLPSRSESVRQGLTLARNQTRVRIRYRDDVDSSMRLRIDGRILQIVGGPAELGRQEFLEMVCEEFTTTGST